MNPHRFCLRVLAFFALPSLAGFTDNTTLAEEGGAPRVLADREFYTQGRYIAYASPWSVDVEGGPKLAHGVDFADEMTVRPAEFPGSVEIAWHWPLVAPKHTGVYGYHAVSYGSFHGGVPETPAAPRRVKDIATLSETFSLSFARGIGEFNVLTEFFLAGDPSGEPKAAEVGFFLHAAKSAIPFAESGEPVGAYTDATGRAWNVTKQPAPHSPFHMFLPANREDVLTGVIDFKAALDFLQSQGQITGEEWFTGLALGIEPVSGSSTLKLEDFSVSFE